MSNEAASDSEIVAMDDKEYSSCDIIEDSAAEQRIESVKSEQKSQSQSSKQIPMAANVDEEGTPHPPLAFDKDSWKEGKNEDDDNPLANI